METVATMSPDRQAAIASEIEFMKQPANRLKDLLDLEASRDNDSSGDDDPSGRFYLMMSRLQTMVFGSPYATFFANVCGGIKSTFRDSFNWAISQLVNNCEALGDCVHYIEELMRDLIFILQQLFKREGYSMVCFLVDHDP
ncbi:hypothetical protein ASPCAL10098 [Aspergillus calidoustus]|uniref:Uncharacterized protein n=1 Tax=Aspergillus calidoustus TaxID=454130 RepID=A0A0U5G5Q6_ASPCI|nr:hypothetical protein ASPCAL10098 [Aspergillus calidoustus]